MICTCSGSCCYPSIVSCFIERRIVYCPGLPRLSWKMVIKQVCVCVCVCVCLWCTELCATGDSTNTQHVADKMTRLATSAEHLTEKQNIVQSTVGSTSTKSKLRKRRRTNEEQHMADSTGLVTSAEHLTEKQHITQSTAGSSSIKPKLRKRRWTNEKLHILFTAFGRDITQKLMPCGKRITELSHKLPGRTVPQIRVQINNFISDKVAMPSL